MSAASYYNVNTQPSVRPGNTYGDGPHPPNDTYQQSQLYTGASYGNEPPPAKPAEPLLNKPSSHVPAFQGRPQKLTVVDPSTNRLRQRKFQKWMRFLRIGKMLTKTITIIFSTVMFGIMILVTAIYQKTKDEVRGGRTAWPKDPKLWPTFMLLAASGVTLALSIVLLLAYCFNFNKARRSWKLTVLKYVIHIFSWLVVSVIYRYEKSLHNVDNDLWGWSCSQAATAIQSEFHSVVNFSMLCNVQSSSWGVSLAEFMLKIAFAVGHFIIYRKTRDDAKQHLADGLGGAFTDGIEDAF